MTQQMSTTAGAGDEATQVMAPEGQAGTDVPALATGVDLIGEYQASGYKEAPCLVRRADGQTIQLTPLLYALVEVIDGRRSTDELAEALSGRIDRPVSDDNVRYLLAEKLRPSGLVKDEHGRDPDVKKANPLLALRFRLKLADERRTNRLTAPFAILFRPWVVAPLVAAFLAVVGWTVFVKGLGGGARQLLYSPPLMLLSFALIVASASFHEFGHAAACRYSGGKPGGMGCGIYLVWPAFYTDVTDAYRLDRRGRLRTDLGGLYFNAIFALATFGVWAVTGVDALLVMIPLQVLQMLHQLLPFVRMDGYHILSDLVGVPDLFARIKPTLVGLVPWRKSGDQAQALKPWVRVVVCLWVLTVVPLLVFSLLMALISAPRVMATSWDSLGLEWRVVNKAFSGAQWADAAVGVLGLIAITLPVAGTTYSLLRFGRRGGTWAWASAGNVRYGRPGLALATIVVAAGAAFTLWPNGEYRPIQPGERGTFADGFSAVSAISTGRPALTPERQDELGGAPARAWTLDGDEATPPTPSTTVPVATSAPATTKAPAASTTTSVARSTTTSEPASSTTVPRTTTTAP
jgi:putative peptide zinc metalloprotease protein